MTPDSHSARLALTSLAQLRAFLAAAALGGFAKAVERPQITRAAISILSTERSVAAGS
ncbi:MAG TPA: hypothetical protein VIP82_00390 [Microbacterium sp.]|jgi:hypothetical protein|uniref:hypothetical protein n=1 Tax=Microbacterium sp. TaxID=51671 RepID=UPI002F91CD48